MAIFVALLFQILFVFFAMVINIGLLVHDKINLQNSVDLGAIYAAQKQAELLNMLAHSNYQIRQSWKLLAWRTHVLGDMGRPGHPGSTNATKLLQLPDEVDPSLDFPRICLAHQNWRETFLKSSSQYPENLCSTFIKPEKPKLPETKVIAPFLGFPIAAKLFVDKMGDVFKDRCKDAGTMNWAFAARINAHYRLEVEYRRKVIDALARDLSVEADRLVDLNRESIAEGVRKTVMKNLTRSNRQRIREQDIQIFNSLEGVSARDWLVPIPVRPLIPYMDFELIGKRCVPRERFVQAYANPNNPNPNGPVYLPVYFKDSFDPGGTLQSFISEPFSPADPRHSTLGVEKNPWYMAYVGVKVDTRQKGPEIFSPLGQSVRLTARAFAKPFGGRIGPWHRATWPRDAEESVGPKTDELVPDRTKSLGVGVADLNHVPNHARYPGDQLGYRSKMALSAMTKYIFTPAAKLFGFAEGYQDLLPPIDGNIQRDSLAWNKNGQEPWFRKLETAAVSPDLFDVMYYSIEPNYYYSYIGRTQFSGDDGLPIMGDLGARVPPGVATFGIYDQVKDAAAVYSEWIPYVIRDWSHVLTGWAQKGAVNYDFPEETFAKCETQNEDLRLRDPALAIPGSCLSGARTGYSVKIISKDYLTSSNLELGGPGQKGALKNPPPEDF